ncbi:hypothetical protein KL919_004118 [Ogataea angusta]|uniref:Uncharacterized protein n=1 Tax=Pichia angusta TaxID=870730 RepID=A0AAN6DEZ8_PICAN|nr:uncharacterized protein KL928_004287 [Ogataea angusta]KAG7816823.1 hypothetical protein KL928_004287 [Ogataea angusta]KAG7823241.1 hypothetical protein KL909_003264 [Ogataea angusta]KAG7838107.1 hypothetical protein KL943_000183 [Ogataea angusta]KAG7844440.1 hypothetical protein KL941_003816 [Ogataea angusta]KAG7856588.1 hypothetical protein KL919_004118 [Ogataea angusta]
MFKLAAGRTLRESSRGLLKQPSTSLIRHYSLADRQGVLRLEELMLQCHAYPDLRTKAYDAFKVVDKAITVADKRANSFFFDRYSAITSFMFSVLFTREILRKPNKEVVDQFLDSIALHDIDFQLEDVKLVIQYLGTIKRLL